MTFSGPQLNYSTLERELCALRWGIKTFRPFLYGVSFILYTDHQPLVHLHNMKIVCARLARTLSELSQYDFEIIYVPGNLNSAADALSRINRETVSLSADDSSVLPKGFVLDGAVVPGGGDSMLVSLQRCLGRLNLSRPMPANEQILREQLVDELLLNPSRYKISFDNIKRKDLRMMKVKGQLPAFDLLMAASHLYSLRVLVYFWPQSPVVYQMGDPDCSVHMQCISGIHFNLLVFIGGGDPPNIASCSVNTISDSVVVNPSERHDDEMAEEVELSHDELNEGRDCQHAVCPLPTIQVVVEGLKLCALMDTGAEISLISSQAVNVLQEQSDIQVGNLQQNIQVVGLSGGKETIREYVELNVECAHATLNFSHKFVVVSHANFPYCILIGMDLLCKANLNLDFAQLRCLQGRKVVCPLEVGKDLGRGSALNFISIVHTASHSLRMSKTGSDFRFEVQGTGPTVTGLNLAVEEETVKTLQKSCSVLKSLVRQIVNGVLPKQWPSKLKQFKRYFSDLKFENGLLIHVGSKVNPVVPFKFMTGLALALHNEFAHVGRDKLLDLVDNLFWSPEKYRICSDICQTCLNCQIMKDFAVVHIPPCLKIQTSYPFEMMAVDLIALPRSGNGFICCLMTVDHYSKWVTAVPLRDNRSESVVEALKHTVFPGLPRVPTYLLSDNGKEFTSGLFTSFVGSLGIKQRLTTPYQPTSNGAVERVNRTIKNLIRGLLDSQSWFEHLPKAVMVYNATVHAELGTSPSNFLLGKAHNCVSNPMVTAAAEPWRTAHPKFLQFKVNQLVLMKVQTVGNLTTNKVQPNFSGPYEVTHVNSNGVTYQVEDVKSGKMVRAHHTKLRPYRQPPEYISSHPYMQRENQGHRPGQQDLPVSRLPGSPVEYGGYSTENTSSEEECSSREAISEIMVNSNQVKRMDCYERINPINESCVWCDHENSREILSDSSIAVSERSLAGQAESIWENGSAINQDWLGYAERIALQEQSNSSLEDEEAIISSHSLTCVDAVVKLFDWSDSEQSVDWRSLPSVESAGMVDESREVQDISAVVHHSEQQVVDNSIGHQPSLPHDDSFHGFETAGDKNDGLEKLEKLLQISPINFPSINASDSDDEITTGGDCARMLRSQGPAPDLPWVMESQLERKKRTRNSTAE